MIARMTDYIRSTTIQGKKEASKNLSQFLIDLKIKYEIVLGYHCFDHKGTHHRVKTILEAKKSMGMYI